MDRPERTVQTVATEAELVVFALHFGDPDAAAEVQAGARRPRGRERAGAPRTA